MQESEFINYIKDAGAALAVIEFFAIIVMWKEIKRLTNELLKLIPILDKHLYLLERLEKLIIKINGYYDSPPLKSGRGNKKK